MADGGKEEMIMYSKNGLLYSMVDEKGNKIGVAIKASCAQRQTHAEES